LIEAPEVLAASAESFDPAIVKAFGHRLVMRRCRAAVSEAMAIASSELKAKRSR